MTAAPADAAALAEARDVVARSGTSFHLGMRVLPKARREAMYAIYAFCRAVDDIADGPDARGEKLAALDAWRGEIENLYQGRPSWPLARALATIGLSCLKPEEAAGFDAFLLLSEK